MFHNKRLSQRETYAPQLESSPHSLHLKKSPAAAKTQHRQKERNKIIFFKKRVFYTAGIVNLQISSVLSYVGFANVSSSALSSGALLKNFYLF